MVKINDVLRSLYAPWREYLTEFLGTYILVLFSLGLPLVNSIYQNLDPLAIAVSLGFLYTGLLYATIHLSGGFLNPAITVGLWFAKKLSSTKTLLMLSVQTLASFGAAVSIYGLFGRKSLDFSLGLVTIGPEKLQLAIFLEVIFTSILVFGVFATMVDRRGPVSFGPLVIGLLTVAASVFALPVTGAIFNPAKVLAASLISGDYAPLVVGLVGPFTASVFGLLYDFVFLERAQKNRL